MISKLQKTLIKKAASLLQSGSLVAFPTETVYGLGANAFDPEAVKKIFQAKGRPTDNPLIVHIASVEDLGKVARDIPNVAQHLAASFWPGPLTMVLNKQKNIPDEVTAGAVTVAVRMPNHPMALELIREAGFPLAAPSANKAGRPSPTEASHVVADFQEEIAMILDGGPSEVGLESTVVDVSGKKVVILRPGTVTAEDLALVLGYKPRLAKLKEGKRAPSPGMKYRHYAPEVSLILFKKKTEKNMIQTLQNFLDQKKKDGLRVAVLCSKEHVDLYKNADKIVFLGSLKEVENMAKNLFASLRQFEAKEIDLILAESISKKGIGHAIMDRLSRAATEVR